MKYALVLLFFGICSLSAQTYVKEGIRNIIKTNKNLSGCNYLSYFELYDYLKEQGETKLSPTPDGYEPFYVSTYARHGSRYLTEISSYESPVDILSKASARGALTEKGKTLLNELQQIKKLCPKEKLGALTSVGYAQHKAIAKRMCKNFPEIFNHEGDFFAQSSVVKRCVRSMNAQMEVIDSVTHKHIPQVSGRKGMQDRLAGHYTTTRLDAERQKGYAPHSKERDNLTPYKRLCGLIFTDSNGIELKTQKSFTRMLFDLAQNMQSHDFNIDLWKYFENDEIEKLYIIKNRHWYRLFGPAVITNNTCPLRSKWQLEDIIEGADSVVARKDWHGANLRFGHDTALMPLICLMELGTSCKSIGEDRIGEVETFWRNHEMFPMAGNIQLIFYRPANGNGEILMKAMLNEREVTLPTTPVTGKYYRWKDVRAYWKNKLN